MAGEEIIVAMVLAMVTIFLMIGIFANRYKRVPPDQAMVVYGRKRGDRGFMVIGPGGGKFILPITETYKLIPLAPRPLSFKVLKVSTSQKAVVDVLIRAEYKISAERTKLDLAVQYLMSRTTESTDQMVKETLAARLRAICSTLGAADLAKEREEVAQKVRGASEVDLGEFGLEIVHLLVVDVLDTASGSDRANGGAGVGARSKGEDLKT